MASVAHVEFPDVFDFFEDEIGCNQSYPIRNTTIQFSRGTYQTKPVSWGVAWDVCRVEETEIGQPLFQIQFG